MRRPFVLGVVATLVVQAVVALLLIASGVIDVAATKTSGIQDRILGYASTRSIAHHAKDEPNPLARDPAALKSGLEHYRDMCVACHGGPGTEPKQFAGGLHPAAPDLASPQVQSFTDGMLYRTVAYGIGSTGMPAFGKTHKPEEIWSIVAFVRHLPALTHEEKLQLGQEAPREHEPAAAAPQGAAPAAPDRGAASATPAPGQQVHQVSISDFKFSPATLEVRAGDIIEWKNADFAAHTATADDRSFDTGPIQTGETKRITVKKAGRFPYFCRYHVVMKGEVIVK
jgi:plastocyanin